MTDPQAPADQAPEVKRPGCLKALVGWTAAIVGALWLFGLVASIGTPSGSTSTSAPAIRWNQGDDPRIGISTIEARESSWGRPTSTSTTTSAGGKTEFWHFDRGTFMFENGVLVSITDQR